MSDSLDIKIKSIGGIVPQWKSEGDAGLDLHASADTTVPTGQNALIGLGIQTEFDPQYVAIIKDRSGLANEGIYTQAGVIDSSYRGEWKVLVVNTGVWDWVVRRGDRIAQVLFLPCHHLLVEEVDELTESLRGVHGFGSTGR